MLRITLVNRTSEEEVYLLEGWVAGEEVGVLAQTCGPALERGARLVLDLRGVRSIEDIGIDLLKHWAGPRLALKRGSPFIRCLLARHSLRTDEDGEDRE